MTEEEKYFPHQVAWLLLNKLNEFDNKPYLIEDIATKFEHLTTHTIYHKFAPLYREACNIFREQGKFPDLTYLNTRFPDGRVIEYMKGAQFSMSLYDKLRKQLDYEIIIQDFNVKIGKSDFIDIESCLEFSKKLSDFANNEINLDINNLNNWDEPIEQYIMSFKDLKTGIKPIDDIIGNIPNGITTIAAPSSHGKTTMAIMIAYNLAKMGKKVVYISLENKKTTMMWHFLSLSAFLSGNPHSISEFASVSIDKKEYDRCIEQFKNELNNNIPVIIDSNDITSSSLDDFLLKLDSIGNIYLVLQVM